jgi:RNAse (barnase) inhibitor barstar
MKDQVEALFSGAVAPGIYRTKLLTSAAALARAAKRHSWQAFCLAGQELTSKAEFLAAIAQAMHFPSYFGRNWDAFEECLNDLSWVPAKGYLLIFDQAERFARAQPEEFATALDILRDGIKSWQAQSTPMIVILRGLGQAASDLPQL